MGRGELVVDQLLGVVNAQEVGPSGGPEQQRAAGEDAHRLALARRLGATTWDVSVQPLAAAGFEPDVLLECSGHPQATVDAIRTVARAGRVVLIGMGGDELTLPLPHVQDRELVLTGAFRYANTWPAAIALVAAGRIDLDVLVTGHYGLDDVGAALTAARRDPTTVKAVVRP